MPQDVVASVTLMLHDQMGAGIDEIKAQLAGLKPTLDGLTGVLGELDATLKQLKMPVTFNDSLKNTANQAGIAAKAVASIGDAAQAADAKLKDLAIPAMPGMADAPGIYNPAIPDGFHGPMQEPGVGKVGAEAAAGGAFGGMEAPHSPGDFMDYITEAMAGIVGFDMIKSSADFDNVLRHAGIAEHLSSGHGLNRMVARTRSSLDALALKDRVSSEALSSAYYYLATTQMNPHLIDQLMPSIARTATAYNTDPRLMGNAAFALHDSFRISAPQMQGALAAMAMAAKLAHFNVEDFGAALPMLGGTARIAGMTGRRNFDKIAAALETVRKNTNLSSEGATYFNDFLNQLHSQMVNRAFDQALFKNTLKVDAPLYKKYGIKPVDLRHLENQAAAHGENPMTAVLDYVHRTIKPMTPTDAAFFTNALFGNMQSRNAVLSIMEHWKSYHGMIGTLDHVNKNTVATDFKSAMQGAVTQTRLFDEEMKQAERLIGKDLVPLLKALNDVLGPLVGLIAKIDSAKILGFKVSTIEDHIPGNPIGAAKALDALIHGPHKQTASEKAAAERAHAKAMQDNTRALHNMTNALGFGPIGANGATHPTSPVGPVQGRP